MLVKCSVFGQGGLGLQLPGILVVDFSFLGLVGGFSSLALVGGFNSLIQDEVEKENGENSVGSSSSLEMRPLSNFDIENILKGITKFRDVYSKDMLPKRI